MKNKNPSKIYLDQEEKEILNSFENEEWQTVKNFEQEKKKQKTAHEGLPYQTLIASVLHKYSAEH